MICLDDDDDDIIGPPETNVCMNCQDLRNELYILKLRVIRKSKELEFMERKNEELRRELAFLRGYREAMRGE